MLGIVLLNYKSFNETVSCVESIIKTTKNTSYHIYIIDNCSPDSSYKDLIQKYKSLDYVTVAQSGKNGGYSYGNNVGIKLASENMCDAMLISNTDIVYFENSIDSMYSKLFKNSNIGVVGPDIMDSNKEYSQINILPPTLKRFWAAKKPFNYFHKNKKYRSKYENDYKFKGMVQGSSFIIKTDVIDMVDSLDEGVFLFGEELILASKLDALNLDTLIDSDALIQHNHSTTISKEGKAFERYHMYYSTIYVLKKYVKCSNFTLTLPIVYNLMFYSLNSINQKSYRKKLKSLYFDLISIYSIRS